MSSCIGELRFLNNEADEDEGLGHAGIETFKDAPYASVARECGQNSSDARIKKPVKIDFDLFEIATTELPSIEKYRGSINSCLIKAESNSNEKEIDFFSRAENILSSNKLKILKISDINTKGLIGPSILGTPFHSLVKSSGVSKKESDISGGSFGIGKNAVFAISDLQTVFYSTVYKDENNGVNCFLSQGKSILISHTDIDDKHKLSTGYWGDDNFQPISNKEHVPEWLRRDLVGTSVYAVGFRESENWQYRMAASLLRNFFCAVYHGDMEFNIDNNRIQINKLTINNWFYDEKIKNAANESDQEEDFEFSKNLYECLISEEVKIKEINIEGLGRISIRILIRDSLPKRLYIVRNGMVICDNLEKFGDKFINFPMYSDFVALVEPLDDEGSALIKRLENPRHDGVSAERISDEDKSERAKKIMKKLAKEIRSAIREQTLSKPEDEMDIDELSKFFADVEPNDSLADPNSDDNLESESYTASKKVTNMVKENSASSYGDEESGADGISDGNGGNGAGDGEGIGSGTSGTGDKGGKKKLEIFDVRNILQDNDKHKRKIMFTPNASCNAVISIQAAGLNTSVDLNIALVKGNSVNAKKFDFEIIEGERVSVEIEFSDEYDGPIEVSVYEKG